MVLAFRQPPGNGGNWCPALLYIRSSLCYYTQTGRQREWRDAGLEN